MIRDNPRKLALYESTIKIVELIVNGVRMKVLCGEILE